MMVKQAHVLCAGTGRLPPLGYDGLAKDAPERRDVKRAFPRFCDDCGGTGYVKVPFADAAPQHASA